MGGRYGGDINGRSRSGKAKPRQFFPIEALSRLGRDTRRPFEAIGATTRRLIPKDRSLREEARV